MLYLEFEISNVKLKLVNYELYYWYDKSGGKKIKNPFWKKKILSICNRYLQTKINNKYFKFHRIVYYAHNPDWDIYNSSHNNQIDHIDRDKLNNNISNLRVVNHRENMINRDWVDNAKGYYYHKRNKKYVAYIKLNNKQICLGSYDTEIEASNKSKKVRLFVKVLTNIYKNKYL